VSFPNITIVNKLSEIIDFIKKKRKILASFFLTIGILSSLIDVLILVQRPHDVRSKATESNVEVKLSPEFTEKFISSKNKYEIMFDKRLWTHESIGLREVFNLNKEYGLARLDIIEGESEKDLTSLTNEIVEQMPYPTKVESILFKEKNAYELTYKENIIGEDIYYYKQIIKDDNKFFIFEKRVPILGYDRLYLDNLLQGVSFVNPQSQREVKGISDYSTGLTTVQLVDQVRPSIANIVYVYCLDIVNLQPLLSGLSKPRYNFCSSTKGSGFIVNEKGFIATNGHVAKVYPEEALMTNLLYEGNKDFSTDLIRGIYLSKGQSLAQNKVEDFYKDINLNPQYLDRFLTEIFRMIGNKIISVATTNERFYVNVGSEPVKVDYQKLNQGDYAGAVIPSSTTYSAKLLDFNYPDKYSYEAIVNKNYQRGADVALLRLENPSNNLFPVLELGSIENLREGSEVVIAGYPTLVEGEEDPRAALSYKTSTKPTVTRGIISSVKEDLSGKVILQTDASIDHGNSGGPAFNSLGQVIGIATFAVESQSGNFNFLRDITELKGLMTKNKIDNKQGKISNFWREGLNNFRNQRFGQALKSFKEVKTLSPAHPSVEEFMERSEKAISNGESLEGLAGLIKGEGSNTLLVVFGSISIVSFMFAGFLTLLPFFEKRYS